MIASGIGWLLVASGLLTGAVGVAALLLPRPFLQFGFGVENSDASVVFFARHWGVLILAFGALIAFAAYDATVRVPILAAAAVEKLAIGLFIFGGPMKRTRAMTALAFGDGLFAALYIAYLVGVTT